MPPAHFIVLEGPDGAGTTLHSRLLSERMQTEGRDVVQAAQPSNGPIGQSIRAMLASGDVPSPAALQLLFCADRADHVDRVIAPALRAGTTVICDRYVLSTLIYGEAQGMDGGWLRAINAPFPVPERTVLLLPPAEVLAERISRRKARDHFEDGILQQRIYTGYRAVRSPGIIIVDTSGPADEVAERIAKEIGMQETVSESRMLS
jgi:dTMP kinase